jgi:hypothetical protein
LQVPAPAVIGPQNLTGCSQSEAAAQVGQVAGSNEAKAAGHVWAVWARRAKNLSSSQRPVACAGNRPVAVIRQFS